MPIFDQVRGAASKMMGSSLGSAVVQGATGAAATGLIAGAHVAGMKAYDALTKARDFKTMMNSPFNADLHEHASNRPEHFNAAFTSLRRTNPNLSKDPMIAGTYMRRMMEFGPTAAGSVLVEALNQRSTHPDPLAEAINRGGQMGVQNVLNERMHARMDEHRLNTGFDRRVEQQRLDARLGPDGGLHEALNLEHGQRMQMQAAQLAESRRQNATNIKAQFVRDKRRDEAQEKRDKAQADAMRERDRRLAEERENLEGLKAVWRDGYAYPDPRKYQSILP